MNVLVLTTSFPLYEGIAVGIHVIEKCRQLVSQGTNVTVLAPHEEGAKQTETMDGVNVNRFRYSWPDSSQYLCYGEGIPTKLKNSWLARLQLIPFVFFYFLAALKEARKADVLHAHWSLSGLIGIFVGGILDKPVILMMHGAEVFVLGDSYFYRKVLRFILKHVDYLICNSSYTLEKTLEVYEEVNHTVVHPGTDTDRFYPQYEIDNFKENIINIESETLLIFSLGKFIERKGFVYLIQAIELLTKSRGISDIHLMMGGRGPRKSQLRKKTKEKGLRQYITFLDYISDEDLPTYYSEADIFVLPSLIDSTGDTEGLGVVLVEANACETPCIASNVGGIPDVIEDGVNGFFVEPRKPEQIANKIEYLKDNPERMREMGRAGREIVQEKFSWEENAKEILEVYHSLY